MTACATCGRASEARFRFCPWCGAAQRRKVVEFFWPHANSAGRALRVSRYFGDDPQVRFSVWDDGVARAAVSLGEDEALRLAEFLEQIRTAWSDPAPAGSGADLRLSRDQGVGGEWLGYEDIVWSFSSASCGTLGAVALACE